jgi:hypothetical protein
MIVKQNNIQYMQKLTRKLIAALIFLFVSNSINAQSEIKNWNAVLLNLSVTKKFDVRFSHLRSYEINNKYNNNFNQSSVSLNYNITSRISVLAGGMITEFPSSATQTQRVYVRATYKLPVAKIVNWSNSIQAEVYSKQEDRYNKRFVYISRIALQKRISILNLQPSVTYWLYYNSGGDAVQYYDADGNKTVKRSADGIHRGRLYLNLNSKITKKLSLSVYYMMQREFNFLTDPYHYINIKRPSGRVTRPFDNYNVIGATISLDFNFFKTK